MTAAALGTTITLPLLEADLGVARGQRARASSVELEIKPGSQSGSEQVLRGHGVPALRGGARGDIVVTVLVETPTRLDERQRELLRELAAVRHEESPDGLIQPQSQRSVFGRFKNAFKMSLPYFLHARPAAGVRRDRRASTAPRASTRSPCGGSGSASRSC